MSNPINGRHIVLGVTGSIAAYKSAEIASSLTKQGAVVDTVLTQSAERFISPLTFQSVTGRKAYTESDLWGGEGHVVHISLARKADLIVQSTRGDSAGRTMPDPDRASHGRGHVR